MKANDTQETQLCKWSAVSFPEVYSVLGCLTDLLVLHKDEFVGYEQTGCMGSTANVQTSCGGKYFSYSTYLDGPNLIGVVEEQGLLSLCS